jgi:hypothetical protein
MAKPKRKLTQVQIRAAAIRALEDKQGRVTASALVEAARSPAHPMHRDFEWDDTKAGHRYRLDQARTFIAEVRVTITTSTKKVIAPGYLRDRDVAPAQGYRATAKLQSDRESAEETLLYETARLQAQLERCREVAAALELEIELDQALTAVKELEGRIRRRSAPTAIHAV